MYSIERTGLKIETIDGPLSRDLALGFESLLRLICGCTFVPNAVPEEGTQARHTNHSSVPKKPNTRSQGPSVYSGHTRWLENYSALGPSCPHARRQAVRQDRWCGGPAGGSLNDRPLKAIIAYYSSPSHPSSSPSPIPHPESSPYRPSDSHPHTP